MQENNNNNVANIIPAVSPASFLHNSYPIKFSQAFTEQENSFGAITNAILISNMFEISGIKVKNKPSRLYLSICAGEQRGDSPKGKGFSGEHIIKRGHLEPFNQKDNPWHTLVVAVKAVLSHINELQKSDTNFAMAWAAEECAFVLVLETPQTYGPYKHLLLTLYFNKGSINKNVMTIGTFYGVPQDTFNEIRRATNKRYVHVSNQAPMNEVIRKWVPKVQPLVEKETNSTYEVLTESMIQHSVKEEAFVETIPYFEVLYRGFVVDEDTNFNFEHIEKYKADILNFIYSEVQSMGELYEKYERAYKEIAKNAVFIAQKKKNFPCLSFQEGKEILSVFSELTQIESQYGWISKEGLKQLTTQECVLNKLILAINQAPSHLQNSNDTMFKSMFVLIQSLTEKLEECIKQATTAFKNLLSLKKITDSFLCDFLLLANKFLREILQNNSLDLKEYVEFIQFINIVNQQQKIFKALDEQNTHLQAFKFTLSNQKDFINNPYQAFRTYVDSNSNITQMSKQFGLAKELELFNASLNEARQKYPEEFPKISEFGPG